MLTLRDRASAGRASRASIAPGDRRTRSGRDVETRHDGGGRRRTRPRSSSVTARSARRSIDFAGWEMPRPVRGHPRGAPRGPRARRAVRPVAHGRAVGGGPGGRRRRSRGALVTRPARARGGPRALQDDLRADGGDHRRPDRLPAGRGALPGRAQRRQRERRRPTRSRSASPARERSSTTRRCARRWSPSRARARPTSSAPLTDVDLAALRYYAIAEGQAAGMPALVARTGYTGEDGFELFVDVGRRGALWDALLDGGRATRASCRWVSARATRCASRRHAALRQRARSRRPARTKPGSGASSSSTSRATSSAAPPSSRSPREGPAKRLVGLACAAAASPATAIRSTSRRSADRRGHAAARTSPTLGMPIAMALRRSGRRGTRYHGGGRDPRRTASRPRSCRCRSTSDRPRLGGRCSARADPADRTASGRRARQTVAQEEPCDDPR